MDDQLAIFDKAMAPFKAREAQEREARDTAMRQRRFADGLIELGRGAPVQALDAARRMLPPALADQVAAQIGQPTRDSAPRHKPGSLGTTDGYGVVGGRWYGRPA